MEKIYTPEQIKLLTHVQTKIDTLEHEYPFIGHEIDHIKRVAKWAKQIAIDEKARNVFLCELAALTHDIGHAHFNQNKILQKKRHHELSYEMLRNWMKEESEFDILSKEEKIELLYSVRYHWNDAANDYDTAWILRDADKIDMLGETGIQRILRSFGNDEKRIDMELRFKISILHWIKTATAKKIIKENKLVEPIEEFALKILRKAIEPIEL